MLVSFGIQPRLYFVGKKICLSSMHTTQGMQKLRHLVGFRTDGCRKVHTEWFVNVFVTHAKPFLLRIASGESCRSQKLQI